MAKVTNFKRKPRVYKKKAKKPYKSKKTLTVKNVMNIVNNNADKKQMATTTYVDQRVGQYAALTGGLTYTGGYNLLSINSVSTGATESTRVGNKIHITGAQIRLQFVQTDAVNTLITGQKIRIIIFYQKGPFTGSPDPTLLLQLDPIYTSLDILSDRNNDYISQFKVVHDKIFKMPTKNTNAQIVPLDLKINLKLNYDQHYYGTSSSSVVDNQLYMLILADSGNIGIVSYTPTTPYFIVRTPSSGLTFNGQSTMYFTDV